MGVFFGCCQNESLNGDKAVRKSNTGKFIVQSIPNVDEDATSSNSQKKGRGNQNHLVGYNYSNLQDMHNHYASTDASASHSNHNSRNPSLDYNSNQSNSKTPENARQWFSASPKKFRHTDTIKEMNESREEDSDAPPSRQHRESVGDRRRKESMESFINEAERKLNELAATSNIAERSGEIVEYCQSKTDDLNPFKLQNLSSFHMEQISIQNKTEEAIVHIVSMEQTSGREEKVEPDFPNSTFIVKTLCGLNQQCNYNVIAEESQIHRLDTESSSLPKDTFNCKENTDSYENKENKVDSRKESNFCFPLSVECSLIESKEQEEERRRITEKMQNENRETWTSRTSIRLPILSNTSIFMKQQQINLPIFGKIREFQMNFKLKYAETIAHRDVNSPKRSIERKESLFNSSASAKFEETEAQIQ